MVLSEKTSPIFLALIFRLLVGHLHSEERHPIPRRTKIETHREGSCSLPRELCVVVDLVRGSDKHFGRDPIYYEKERQRRKASYQSLQRWFISVE